MLNHYSGSIMGNSQKFGLMVEDRVISHISGLGFSVLPYSNFLAPFDGLIEGVLPLEVKAASPRLQWSGQSGRVLRFRWQFDLSSVKQSSDCLLVLACLVRGEYEYFVLPSSVLCGRRMVQITSAPGVYSGWLASYLGAWGWCDFLLARCYRQVNYSF